MDKRTALRRRVLSVDILLVFSTNSGLLSLVVANFNAGTKKI